MSKKLKTTKQVRKEIERVLDEAALLSTLVNNGLRDITDIETMMTNNTMIQSLDIIHSKVKALRKLSNKVIKEKEKQSKTLELDDDLFSDLDNLFEIDTDNEADENNETEKIKKKYKKLKKKYKKLKKANKINTTASNHTSSFGNNNNVFGATNNVGFGGFSGNF